MELNIVKLMLSDSVQDFLNRLQEESGYKAEEKKTILQRITEWLNDII